MDRQDLDSLIAEVIGVKANASLAEGSDTDCSPEPCDGCVPEVCECGKMECTCVDVACDECEKDKTRHEHLNQGKKIQQHDPKSFQQKDMTLKVNQKSEMTFVDKMGDLITYNTTD